MKRKLVYGSCFLCTIMLIIAVFLTVKINSSFSIEEKAVYGNTRIINNDILKSAEEYLIKGDDKDLEKLLESYACKLELYDLEGRILYGQASKNEVDVNRILETTSNTRHAYFIKPKGENVLAIISNKETKDNSGRLRSEMKIYIWAFLLLVIVILFISWWLINSKIFKPFKKLEDFTGEVAKGNLDLPLVMERDNFFGAFTWAFDMLRQELKDARKREGELENSKKEMVAALSHDIRTPIAAIRAYGECLEALRDRNTDRAERYIDGIINKSDEIGKLSHDMFLHAISDLERLEITGSVFDSRELCIGILEPLMLQFENRIAIKGKFPQVNIFADRIRLSQVFENIIGNSVKYAPESRIEISSFVDEEMLHIRFRDFGEGVNSEELSLIFDKFYRGENAKTKMIQGSGIGLYISRYIMDRLSGGIRAGNVENEDLKGFYTDITVKIIK